MEEVEGASAGVVVAAAAAAVREIQHVEVADKGKDAELDLSLPRDMAEEHTVSRCGLDRAYEVENRMVPGAASIDCQVV